MTEYGHKRLPVAALVGLVILTALAPASMGQQAATPAMVANSQYDNWAPFGLDASATLSMIDRDTAGTILSDAVQTQTVTALTDESLTLGTQVQYAGQPASGIMDVVVPAMVPTSGPAAAGVQMTTVVAPALESITVPAGTFDCTLTTDLLPKNGSKLNESLSRR
jgi:hypothetical protein